MSVEYFSLQDSAIYLTLKEIRDELAGSLTVDGSVSVLNFPSIQPVSGPLTNAELRLTPVPVSGTVAVSNFPAVQPISAATLPLPTGAATEDTLTTLVNKFFSSTAAITASPAILTTPSVKIIAANANRKGLYIYNNSANSIYIAFGSPANSSTNMTQIIPTFTAYVLPFPVYRGDIYAVRNSGSGSALITELT